LPAPQIEATPPEPIPVQKPTRVEKPEAVEKPVEKKPILKEKPKTITPKPLRKHTPPVKTKTVLTIHKKAPTPDKPKKKITKSPKQTTLTSKESSDQKKGLEKARVEGGKITPEYLYKYRKRGQEGIVTIRVQILASGKASKITLISSCGYSGLDEAALKAVRAARFIPARRWGKPVNSEKEFEFKFSLEK